jgi:AraC-like DNA-binding protein
MEDYNKIIESLNVHYKKSNNIRITQPITIENFYDVENSIIRLNRGQIRFGKDKTLVNEGDILFVPEGKNVSVSFGSGEALSLSNDDFISRKENYFKALPSKDLHQPEIESFTYVNFEAKVFDSVNFFASLDIPAFIIGNHRAIRRAITTIIDESNSQLPGREGVIRRTTDLMVIEMIRYILKKQLFVEQLATNSTYFNDPRLINIFAYIKNHLDGDLSNKNLASVANVSEDYVGQYFKMLTGINPQDYIEYQRMEQAVNLLRTSKKSIRDIGSSVGYKDTAYFCRRFKMMFGIPAGKMRRRESLMNV